MLVKNFVFTSLFLSAFAIFAKTGCCAVKFTDLERPVACTTTQTTSNVAQANATYNYNLNDSTDAED